MTERATAVGVVTERDGARGPAWLHLLQELTARRQDWLAWKGYESALAETGDVDTVAPAEAWPHVTEAFTVWARSHGLGPVVVCPDAPGLLHMIALPTAATSTTSST
jgi:hypothetical protein